MLASKYETCLLFNDQQKNLGSPCGHVHFKDKLSKILPSDAELSDSLTAYFKSLRLDTTLNRIIEQEMNGVKKITPESIWKNLSYSQKRWQLFTVLYEEAIDFVSMDTLCIAISLLDRCYSRKPSIPSKAFKIYAIGSLFVACKLTSDYTVAKKSFCKQLAPSLSIRELEKYEKIVLSLLSYDIYVLSLPSVESYLTPLIFQHWYFKTLSEEDSEQMMCEWQYMLVEIMKGML
ncbi:meiosis specific cyclin Crs1 [Schizosaccharomyces octosporus yFS286]|uniref:Meiosis specific cyclin Crs1 n=1 Tax=Schizosaccharomyces octosporus (strain yFS286) TaxID=483514 RepID=S9QZD8_SCHOY|nr:meiosis specific cyclin Crs1 [Schizosaccharomyces octosporus yFS286]EPX71590.1 meiosis specific cyclin Crs1 [Schizosaccharomyces octosporus yFS286]